ncbi:hypothetical protein GALL_370670 [mine drainage metagenome]|uniref:Uncharacterized protein n=1 Tax=mine drainage metagenome TaxID=410659 RepID=A0A1J5QUK2_9ZZZZ
MNSYPASLCRALVAGLLVPALSGCDGDDGTPRPAAASTPADEIRTVPAGRQFGQHWPRPAGDDKRLDVAPASPHAGAYRGSLHVASGDSSDSSSDSSGDADGEALLLLGVDPCGRINGFVRGVPGIHADEWLNLHGTIAHHQTSAPLLLSDRRGRRYGAISLDFKRGGSHREVVGTILRKNMAELSIDALPLDDAAELDGDRLFTTRHLDLQLDDRPPLRDAAAFELHIGDADERGARQLHACGGGVTLNAKLSATGVDGLYDALVHLVADAGDAPLTSAPRVVAGQLFVERLTDGRLSWALIGAGQHARVLIEASEQKPAE